MKALQAHVDSMNKWNSLFGNYRALSLKNAKDRQAVADDIDCKLSPENLTCDGELPRSQIQARYRALTQAARELQALDPSVKFYEFA